VYSPYNSLSISTDLPGKIISDFGANAILKPDGTLWTWGNNFNGELGHGTEESVDIPTRIKAIEKIVDIDLYGGMCLAADVNGSVWFWGSNMYSGHIWPRILSPVKISHLSDIKKVDLNGYILRNDGSVWRIEIDSNANNYFYSPQLVAGINDVISIS
jgi:alpha-tubulin suppressor-like RCC1 family protein